MWWKHFINFRMHLQNMLFHFFVLAFGLFSSYFFPSATNSVKIEKRLGIFKARIRKRRCDLLNWGQKHLPHVSPLFL